LYEAKILQSTNRIESTVLTDPGLAELYRERKSENGVTIFIPNWNFGVIHKLQRDLHSLKGRRVALLGLSFKPNTDDLRGTPSLAIAGALTSLGARVVGFDPVAGKAAARLAPDIQAVFDPYEGEGPGSQESRFADAGPEAHRGRPQRTRCRRLEGSKTVIPGFRTRL
jgi:UDP-glucose/GDP-mannose dehydrogenase family, UDP binding domain